jgi:hypothetical protein
LHGEVKRSEVKGHETGCASEGSLGKEQATLSPRSKFDQSLCIGKAGARIHAINEYSIQTPQQATDHQCAGKFALGDEATALRQYRGPDVDRTLCCAQSRSTGSAVLAAEACISIF